MALVYQAKVEKVVKKPVEKYLRFYFTIPQAEIFQFHQTELDTCFLFYIDYS